jgi:WD40 repeat protein
MMLSDPRHSRHGGSADSRRLRARDSAGAEADLEVWNLEAGAGKPPSAERVNTLCQSLAMTSPGGELVGLLNDGSAFICPLDTLAPTDGFQLRRRSRLLDVDPSRSRTVFGSGRDLVVRDLRARHSRTVAGPVDGTCVAVSPGGALALTAAGDGLVAWDVASGSVLPTLAVPFSEHASAIAVFPDRSRVAGSSDHAVTVWDLESGQRLRR